MLLNHCGKTYECAVAVKCENDKYIKLYDENGAEIMAFHNISDFEDFEISGGSYTDPCHCIMPISLSTYAIGGRTIAASDWVLADSGKYYYEIENDLISGNATTCNILLIFAANTLLPYEGTQEDGKVVLFVNDPPAGDIVIESIQIMRT